MVGIAQNGQKRLMFILVPQVRTKMREKFKREKKKIVNKSKKNTLIYIHVNIYTHSRTHKHIYMQICTHVINIHIYTNAHMDIIYYSSQIVLFDIACL